MPRGKEDPASAIYSKKFPVSGIRSSVASVPFSLTLLLLVKKKFNIKKSFQF